MQHIAFLPLNISAGMHREYGFIAFSQDWDSLEDLLVDPIKHILENQRGWLYEPTVPIDDQKPWDITRPVTGVLKCGYSDNISMMSMIDYMLYTGHIREEGYVNKGIETLNNKELHAKLAKDLKCGAYFAEFAWETGVLFVTYFPPTEKKGGGNCSMAQKYLADTYPYMHDSNELLQASVATVKGHAKFPDHGMLHYDITHTKEARAEFAVSHITNPEKTYDLLNKALATKPLLPFKTKFVDKTQKIPKMNPSNPIKKGSPLKSRTESEGMPDKLLLYPTVIIEGLSDANFKEVCTFSDVVDVGTEADPEYIADTVVVKSYYK